MPQIEQWMRDAAEEILHEHVYAGYYEGLEGTAAIIASEYEKAHARATPATGVIDRAILMWRNAPDETFSVPHLMVDFAKSEMLRVAEAAPTTPEWTWRVLQMSREVEAKRAQMRELGLTAKARYLDDEIHFLEREIVNFVRNAAFSREAGTQEKK